MLVNINYYNKLILRYSMFYKTSVKIICAISLLLVITSELNATDKFASHEYTKEEIIALGDNFFGKTSGDLAKVVSKIFNSYGKPSNYILGFETSASIVGGITYGKGSLYNKAGDVKKLFWSGPSVGADVGGQASRLMILVYNLNNIEELWRRYPGLSGSAYLLAGAGFNVLQRDNILLVPVKAGIGARLGVNFGYLKFREHPTINPF